MYTTADTFRLFLIDKDIVTIGRGTMFEVK